MLQPLSHNSCHICMYTLYTKINDDYGTEVVYYITDSVP